MLFRYASLPPPLLSQEEVLSFVRLSRQASSFSRRCGDFQKSFRFVFGSDDAAPVPLQFRKCVKRQKKMRGLLSPRH